MTDFIYNNPSRKNARQKLRKDSTKEEVLLWSRLRNNGIGFKFKRQYSVGGYIIDFYCPAKRVAIELDGSQHKTNKEYDITRTKLFEELDIQVVRFWNSEVTEDTHKVIEKILSYCK